MQVVRFVREDDLASALPQCRTEDAVPCPQVERPDLAVEPDAIPVQPLNCVLSLKPVKGRVVTVRQMMGDELMDDHDRLRTRPCQADGRGTVQSADLSGKLEFVSLVAVCVS